MPRFAGKLLATVLLTLCVGIHIIEVSGRWDQTFQDANDEAGIVAVVLCIGIAVSVAGTLLKRLTVRRSGWQPVIVMLPTITLFKDVRFDPPNLNTPPPLLPLRI